MFACGLIKNLIVHKIFIGRVQIIKVLSTVYFGTSVYRRVSHTGWNLLGYPLFLLFFF